MLRSAPQYSDAITLLAGHFPYPQSALLWWLQFRQRHQLPGETAHQYVANLRCPASSCKFGALQDEMLRDQLIEHTNMEKVREKLLLKPDDHSLVKALQLAFQLQSAADCAAGQSCRNCGWLNHLFKVEYQGQALQMFTCHAMELI